MRKRRDRLGRAQVKLNLFWFAQLLPTSYGYLCRTDGHAAQQNPGTITQTSFVNSIDPKPPFKFRLTYSEADISVSALP